MPCCPCIIIIGDATRAPIDDTGSYTTHLSFSVIQRLAQSVKGACTSSVVGVFVSVVVALSSRVMERASSAFRGRVDARVVTFHFKFKPTFQIDARVCVYDGRRMARMRESYYVWSATDASRCVVW